MAALHMPNGPKAREFLRAAIALAGELDTDWNGNGLMSDHTYFTYNLRDIHWAWPLKRKVVPLGRLDRRQPLLGGPLFTSELYPWPKNDDGYLQPIAQIDLTLVRRVSGLDLGNGMLQVWADWGAFENVIRAIPMDHIRRAELAPFPCDLKGSKHLEYPFSSGLWEWEVLGSGLFSGERSGECWASQITGVAGKKLTWPKFLQEDVEWVISDAQNFLEEEIDYFEGHKEAYQEAALASQIVRLYEERIAPYQKTLEALSAFRNTFPKPYSSFSYAFSYARSYHREPLYTNERHPVPHLFGCFDAAQYTSSDIGMPCLLSLGSTDGQFDILGGGTAQLFFNPNERVVDEYGTSMARMKFRACR